MRKMEAKNAVKRDFKVSILAFLLTLYGAAQIVFPLSPYIFYTNLLNLILIAYYFLLTLLDENRKFYINDVVIAYALFGFFAISSVFWTVDPVTSGNKAKTLFLLIINNFVIYNIFKRFDIGNAFLNGIILGAVVNYLLAFDLIHIPMETYLGYRFFGTMGNPNGLSIAMVMTVGVSIIYLEQNIDKKYKILIAINLMLALYMIVLTVSRTGLVLGFFLFFVYVLTLLTDFRKIGYFFAGLIPFGIYLHFFADMQKITEYLNNVFLRLANVFNTLSGADMEKSTLERKEYIERGLEFFSNHPFKGIGIDTFRYYYGGYSHNNFVELLLGVGIIGEVLYYSIYGLLFYKIFKMDRKNLKIYLFSITLALFAMDMGTVSYYDKLTLLMLIYISYLAEKYQKIEKVKSV